uniref:Uncharacterized protein n=1 Tax=Panagrolaimus sp. PS1159 TaxID=55785 RepID=A0AC35FRN1_9BILA
MEIKCFIYLSKKLTVPFTRELRCVSWNQNRGFVCAGGVDGSVRLFKLHPDSDKNMNNPFYMNSALEGHGPNANVEIAQWNEYYQKLTTSDDSGMIIVWSPNQHDNSWYEEMVNNRNKSTIMDMKWSPDGQKVSIVYEDEGFLPSVLKLDTFEKNYIVRSPISPTRPRLAIAFQNGVVQLMKNEMDSRLKKFYR